MFNIETKTDYGFIIMLELAKHHKQGYLSLSEIASAKKLSAGYLAQLIYPLVKTGLIVSKEGKGGGYALAKDPKRIFVLEIIEAFDGPLHLVKCLKINSKLCDGFHVCEAKKVWPIIIKEVRQVLAKKNLATLLKEIV